MKVTYHQYCKVCSEPANWTRPSRLLSCGTIALLRATGREKRCAAFPKPGLHRSMHKAQLEVWMAFSRSKEVGSVLGESHLLKGNTLHHLQVATEGMFSETQLWTQAPNIYLCLFQVSKPLQIFLLTMENQYSVNVFKSPDFCFTIIFWVLLYIRLTTLKLEDCIFHCLKI